MQCQQTATAVMPCTSNPEVFQSCSRHCGASRRAFSDTPLYTCGWGLSKNMPGAWRYPPPPPHHATPHTIIFHEFHKLDVFFCNFASPRRGGGNFGYKVTWRGVNKKNAPKPICTLTKSEHFCSTQHPTTSHRGGKRGRGGDWGRRGETGTIGVCGGRRRGRGGGTGGGRRWWVEGR